MGSKYNTKDIFESKGLSSIRVDDDVVSLDEFDVELFWKVIFMRFIIYFDSIMYYTIVNLNRNITNNKGFKENL